MRNGKTNFAAFSRRTEFVFLLKSIELISVEEVSNFQMQTANLCESSALPRSGFNLFTFLLA